MKNKKLESNREFAFLYKTTRFRPTTISLLAQVPEFMDALRKFRGRGGFLDENSIYEIVRNTYNQMLLKDKRHTMATTVMNLISKDVTGNALTWRNKSETEKVNENCFRRKEIKLRFYRRF